MVNGNYRKRNTFHNIVLVFFIVGFLRKDIEKNIYSETRLNRTSLGPYFVIGIDGCSVYIYKKTKISYIQTLFKVRFIQDLD